MANLNTAAGTPSPTVAAVHYLNVVLGGTLSAAPGAPNRFVVLRIDVDVAMLNAYSLLALCMERHALHAS
jgi:hypothetical protein